MALLGQVSRALAPHVARLVGVDISPRMVELYNARADAQGLESHEMCAVGALAELGAQDRFDLIVVRSSLLPLPAGFTESLRPSARWRTTILPRSTTSRASSSSTSSPAALSPLPISRM